MRRDFLIKKIALLLFLVSFVSIGQDHNDDLALHSNEKTEEADSSLRGEIKEFINHHLLDSHDFSLFSYEDEQGHEVHVGIPLPVILFDSESGLHVFSSSKFHHGETVAENNGSYFKLYHSKIYITDAAGSIIYDDHHHATNIKPIDFSITKNVVFIFLVGFLMFFMFTKMAKNYKTSVMPKV